ncbi:MAG: hypothetical protein KY410_01475 [Proteobacteria bacterium]|nr:hypothetical protein [Pseudomonadota bacterium]
MNNYPIRWMTPFGIGVLLFFAAFAMPLHEMGHWLWGTLVDGKTQVLHFTRVTNADGTTFGTLGGIAAGPLASALMALLGIVLLWFSGSRQLQLAGATLALVVSYQRLTIYFISLFKGMAANDEGIVARQLGLHDWAFALPLSAIFVAAILAAWKGTTISSKAGWFASVYTAMFLFTLAAFWLDSLIFK